MRILVQLAVVAAICSISAGAKAEGDPTKGENVFKKCKICHQIGDGAKNAVGPVLTGVIGRKAGTGEGFNYSPAMKKAGEDGTVWSDENIDKYLADPKGFIPQNKMAFVGLKQPDERADVIAYLKKFSSQ